ncbi:MAG: ribosome recycling factor [Pseudomonadota bacterium]
MIDEILADANERMGKSLESLQAAFARIRTGRANPALLDTISVEYYGSQTPLNQVASISVEDGRTLVVSPWEKPLVPDIEKAILKSDLGITPVSSGDVIRVPLPPLTEENRKDLARQAKQEAENGRVAIRNIRREAIADVRELVKEKEATEDEGHKAEERMQGYTDSRVAEVDAALATKEADLMEI